jgi:predicted dehydrogenase
MEIGIVGLETQGNLHAEILDQMGHDVVGVDITLEHRDRFAEQFDTETYERPAALFERGVDAVWVTAPNKFCERPAVDAFEAGLDVFVEKPLAHTLDSARAIYEAARESSGIGMVGYPDLFFNSVDALKRRIDEGYFGDIYHVEATHIRRQGIPEIGSWFTNEDLAGGGALLDLGSNVVALLDYLVDDPTYTDAQGVTRQAFGHQSDYWDGNLEESGTRAFTVDDSASVQLRAERGFSASIEVAWAANRPTVHEYHVYGTKAGAYLNLTGANRVAHHQSADRERLTLHTNRGPEDEDVEDAEIDVVPEAAYNQQFERFLEAVRTGQQPSINTIEDGYRVQQTIETIYEESAGWEPGAGGSGNWVTDT